MTALRLRLVFALVLLAAAVVAALLASDLHAWQRTLRSDDAVRGVATPSTRLPRSWSGGIVGVQHDLDVRRAMQLFRKNAYSTVQLANAVGASIVRSQTETALAVAAQTEHDPKRVSQLVTLGGVMVFGDFSRGTRNAAQAQATKEAFTSAIQLDPSNEDAKYDLELALRLMGHRGLGSSLSSQSKPGQQNHRGAGGGAPGKGY